ncbi:hypothetical protein BH23CHL8_BH23CHL8_09910 [soil metagenome]
MSTTQGTPAAPGERIARVLAVVVNHEGADRTIRCLQSLLAIDHPGLDLLVVDSASADDSVARLQAAFPHLPVLAMEQNRGYAAALNVGLRHALERGADHVWLLNNDVVVAPDALREALRVATSVPRAGVVAASQFAPARAGLAEWEDGRTYPCATLRGRLRDRHLTCDGSCAGTGWHRADVVTGAALLVSSDLVRTNGFLDETYFHYGEEDDYSERASAAGFVNLLACRAHVWHERGATLDKASPQAAYYRLRNLFLLRRRVDGWSAVQLLARPGYARAVANTWLRLRGDERSRLAVRSALRHGMAGRDGRVDLPRAVASRPTRLLVVTHSAAGYGAEQSLLSILSALLPEGFRPIVVVPREGLLIERLRGAGIPTLVVPNRAWRGRRSGLLPFLVRFWTTAAASWRIARIIRTCDVDIVCTWTLGVTAGAFAAWWTGRPHVWYARELIAGNSSMHGPLPERLWLRMVERLSDAVVSVSQATREQFPGAGRGKHVVVHNVLSVERTAEPRARAWAPGATRVAVIGAVAPHKRTIDAVRAFEVLRRDDPEAVLDVWGDGPPDYRRIVEAEVRRLGLDGSVRLRGFESDPRVFLDADIVLAPSYPEAFGLAILEAMAAGLPVIVARSEGAAEVVGDGDGAILVPAGDWRAMGREAARILADEGRYRQVARSARARASAFSKPDQPAPHARVLEEVLAASRRRSDASGSPHPGSRGSP